jgi:hypothetical protein
VHNVSTLGWYLKSLSALASLWLLAAVANAQFLGIQESTIDASRQNAPIIADITLQTTSITPWGTYTQLLNGKFWRSRDGKYRQDDSFGTSLLRSAQAETWVDQELQTAMVTPANRPPFFTLPIAIRKSAGKGIVDGRTVLEWSRLPPNKDVDFHFDVWNDIRLGVPIQIRQKTSTTEIVQHLINIEGRDPDPELFKIPEGFSVLKCTPTASRPRSQVSNRPVSCSGGR